MGDTHLHPNAWASMPKVCGDTYNSFQQMIHWAIDHRADEVVLPGDIFDTHPPADAVAVFIRACDQLQRANIPLFTIQGQHGRSRTVPWPQIHSWAVNLEGYNMQSAKGLNIRGFDNRGPEELREKLIELKDEEVDVLFLHQMCRGFVPDMDGSWDLDPIWVPPQVRLVVMGDLHKPIEFHFPREEHGGSTRFVYTGSGAMMSIDETPDKSFLVIDEKTLSYYRVPLKTRAFKKFELRPNKDIAALQAQLDSALIEVMLLEPETLCVVNFDPHLPNVEEAFRARAPGVHFMFRPVALETAALEIRDVKASNVSLIGCLDKVVDRVQEPWLHSFMLQLLPARDPKGLILEARKGVVNV